VAAAPRAEGIGMADLQPPSGKRGLTGERIALLVCVAVFLAASWLARWPANGPKKLSIDGLGVFVAAGLTLIMYSFLYRDNPLFKIAENLYVGVALGYGAILTWRLSLKPEIIDPLFLEPPNFAAFLSEFEHRIVPIILGLCLLTQLSRRYGWLSRYAYTVMVGWGAGIGIPIVAHTFILEQLQPSIMPIYQPGNFWGGVGTLTILIGVVAVLFYFFFSIEHKGPAGAVSRVGIWFLMISFGASFGYTVMGRVSLLIGRVEFLIHTWLGFGP